MARPRYLLSTAAGVLAGSVAAVTLYGTITAGTPRIGSPDTITLAAAHPAHATRVVVVVTTCPRGYALDGSLCRPPTPPATQNPPDGPGAADPHPAALPAAVITPRTAVPATPGRTTARSANPLPATQASPPADHATPPAASHETSEARGGPEPSEPGQDD